MKQMQQLQVQILGHGQMMETELFIPMEKVLELKVF